MFDFTINSKKLIIKFFDNIIIKMEKEQHAWISEKNGDPDGRKSASRAKMQISLCCVFK